MTDKPTNEGASSGGALALTKDQQLAKLREQGGATESSALVLPLLKLEHTTIVGDPNPNKGKFSLSRKNNLGEWEKEILGDEVAMQILLQRFVLSFVDNDISYSSMEFDNPNEIVRLWKSTGQGDDRKSEMYAEDTPAELSKKFLIKKNDRVVSQLKLLVVLYVNLEHDGKIEMVKWPTNVSGTVGYRKYSRKTHPFAVLTKVTREEAISGTNKYYQPKFHIISELADFNEAIEQQEKLKASLNIGGNSAVDAALNVFGGEVVED